MLKRTWTIIALVTGALFVILLIVVAFWTGRSGTSGLLGNEECDRKYMEAVVASMYASPQGEYPRSASVDIPGCGTYQLEELGYPELPDWESIHIDVNVDPIDVTVGGTVDVVGTVDIPTIPAIPVWMAPPSTTPTTAPPATTPTTAPPATTTTTAPPSTTTTTAPPSTTTTTEGIIEPPNE